jgi:hypothetical protein
MSKEGPMIEWAESLELVESIESGIEIPVTEEF